MKFHSLFFCFIFLSGCSLAPGLYVDNLDPEDFKRNMSSLFGEKYSLVSIDADLVRKIGLQNERKTEPESMPGQKNDPYRAGPYDILRVSIWERAEMKSAFSADGISLEKENVHYTTHPVESSGEIYYPNIGAIHVEGLTVREIREKIREKLSNFIPDPQLDVRIAEFRSKSAYIMGEVQNPGPVPIKDKPATILDAVAAKGGLTQSADPRSAVLIRENKSYPVNLLDIYEKGNLSLNFFLKDGDLLRIPDNRLNKVFLFGEFTRPKATFMPNHRFMLIDAIGSAEGFDFETVDTSRIMVFRLEEDRPVIYHLNAESAEAILLATLFPMKPKDIVYAAPTDLARWNRFIRQILPTLSAFWYSSDTIERIRDTGGE